VARAGRFGTKGLAITFVSDESDAKVLNEVQERFEVNITELPEEIDLTSYSKSTRLIVAVVDNSDLLWTQQCLIITNGGNILETETVFM